MKYRIEFTKAADRQFSKLPEREQKRLALRIDELADEPRPAGCRKLEGADDLYRIRSGDYRVVYQVADRVITVTVVRVGHRRDIYK